MAGQSSLSKKSYIDLLNRCIKEFCEESPETALNRILEILGEELQSSRIALYEQKPSNEYFFLSYYYGDSFDKNFTKRIKNDFLSVKADIWKNFIAKRETVIIGTDTAMRAVFKIAYDDIRKAGIHSVIIVPLYSDSGFLGFLCIANASPESFSFLRPSLNTLSQFIGSAIKKRNLIGRLNFMSFHDNLTKALNRNALNRDLIRFKKVRQRGVVYADLCGLKKINDTKGHKHGDQLLLSAYACLNRVYNPQDIYRIGGDEFIILCSDCSQNRFEQKLKKLHSILHENRQNLLLAVGSFWDDSGRFPVNRMIDKAEIDMYRNKRNIYCDLNAFKQKKTHLPQVSEHRSLFADYIRNYYFDPEILINAISDQEKPYYLYIGDMKENVFYISDRMKDDFSFDSNIVRDLIHKWGDLIVDRDKGAYYDDINAILTQKKECHNICYQIRNAKGEIIWVHCQGVIKWENGTPLFFAGIVSNLQEERNIDPITGLWGPSALINQLEILSKTGGWIIGIGLNDFSSINNSIGRTEGNLILRNIAQIFQIKLGHLFHFYRIDNIKFVAVSRNPGSVPSGTITENIKNITETIYSSHHLFMQKPCSIGFLKFPKNYPADEEIVQTLSNLINQAKDRQSENYVTLSEEILNEKQKKAQILISLNKSVSIGFSDFFIEIQPITDKTKKNIIAGEVLLRWRKNGEIVSPGEFIPILENHNLIQPVGSWVFEEAVKACKQLTQIKPDFRLSVNVSYLQVQDPAFFDFIMTTVKKHDISPSSLVLELTETVNHDSHEILFDFITRIKKEGFLFAIDDLGSGYSSLNFLFECPADIVKMDRTLTHKLIGSILNYRLLKTIIFGCHESGKKICIEGIETDEEMKLIDEMDFDFLQGFYFYKPISPEKLISLLNRQSEEKE